MAKGLVDRIYGPDGLPCGTKLEEMVDTVDAVRQILSEKMLAQALERQAQLEQRPERRAYWGMGIASGAPQLLLREAAKSPLDATAATRNGASIRVLQECEFVVAALDGYFTDMNGDMSWAQKQDAEWQAPRAGSMNGKIGLALPGYFERV